jgi:hypothetical protein
LFQSLTDSVVNDVSPDAPASSSSWLSGSIWAHDGPILFPWLVFDPNQPWVCVYFIGLHIECLNYFYF